MDEGVLLVGNVTGFGTGVQSGSGGVGRRGVAPGVRQLGRSGWQQRAARESGGAGEEQACQSERERERGGKRVSVSGWKKSMEKSIRCHFPIDFPTVR